MVIGPKNAAAAVLYHSRILDALHRPTTSRLVVICYHRIRRDGDAAAPAFDVDVFGPTASQFTDQLRWLKRHTTILSEDDLIELAESGKPYPGVSSHVTFDDGYRDNYDVALPVLRQLGVPATFFIPTGLIDRRRLGWWDVIAYLIRSTSRNSIEVLGRDVRVEGRKSRAIVELQDAMKREPASATEDLLSAVSRACDVALPESALQDAELMTWEQVKDAADQGVSIGSHSHTHRVFTTLDPESVKLELTRSKSVLEGVLGREVRSVAYPCGGYEHFDEASKSCAEACGFRLGFSLNTGSNPERMTTPFDVRRVSSGLHVSRLAAMVVLPQAFSWAQ